MTRSRLIEYRFIVLMVILTLAPSVANALAGIGEHDPIAREMCCRDLASFGPILDRESNRTGRGQARVISKPDSPVKIAVIPTNEELEIARQTVEVLKK